MSKIKWCYPDLNELDEAKASTIIESYEMIARTVSRLENELSEKYCNTCPHRKLEDGDIEFDCIRNSETCDCAIMKLGYIVDAVEEHEEEEKEGKQMISEENPNRWDNEYVIRAYDHTKKEQRDFSLTEFTEEDWRKWVCWKLDQQDKRIKLLEVLLKNIAGEAEKQGLVRKRK